MNFKKVIILLVLYFFTLTLLNAKTSISFFSGAYHFNNDDQLTYNQNSYSANKSVQFLNTDDRANVITGLLQLKYDTSYKKTEFNIDVARQGVWGTDNFQGRDQGRNPILVNRLHFWWYPTENISFLLGRHRYSIGEADRDYFFSDVLDGILLKYSFSDDMSIELEGDVVSNAAKPSVGIYGLINKDDEQVQDFNGDTVTARGGLNFSFKVPDLIGFKLFSYYLRYGGNTLGGADIAENGRNDINKADGDFLSMSGVRTTAKLGDLLEGDLTFAYSIGQDAQFDSTRKYNGFGTALAVTNKLNISDDMSNKATLGAGFFHKDFASMKGNSMGGQLLYGYRLYYASAYTNFYSFRDEGKRPDAIRQIDATNSKTFARLEDKFKMGGLGIRLMVLGLFQTDGMEYMGLEDEIEFTYKIDNIQFGLLGAIFLPSDYYSKRASTNFFLPQGSEPFYGGSLTVTYVLDLSFVNAIKEERDKEPPVDRTDELLDDQNDAIDADQF